VFVLCSVLVILGITLSPLAPGYFKAVAFCIACSRRWLADGLLNVMLFFPFGLAVSVRERSLWKPIVWGAALSVGIEFVQEFMPGRTAAVNDIIFNTIGAIAGGTVGFNVRKLVFPSDKLRVAFLTSTVIGSTALCISTLILLSPIESRLIPRRVDLLVPAGPVAGPGEIVALVDVDIPSSDERFYFGRESNDFIVRYPTKASVHGLDQPEYWLRRPSTEPGSADSMLVSLRREASQWVLAVGREEPVSLGPTVGQGWTLLAYPEAIGRTWGSLLNGIWVAALFAFVGFWTSSRVELLAGSTVVLLLILIPTAVGTPKTNVVEWTGAVAGFLLALATRRLLDFWRSDISIRNRL